MKVLQFNTQEEYDMWIDQNELFDFFDTKGKCIGQILGPDADTLEKFNIAVVFPPFGCRLKAALTEKQMELLKKNTLVTTVIVDETLGLTHEQKNIVDRLRKDFDEARKANLYVITNDDENALFFLNGGNIDCVRTEDDMSGEWCTVDGNKQFVPLSDEVRSHFVKIDIDACECIEGDSKIDFMNWGSCNLPWYAHLIQ